MDNPLLEWLEGASEIPQDIKEVEEKRRKIASSIVTLTSYPEWETFSDELVRLLKAIDKGSEYYANNPNIAWYDTGAKHTIELIQRFVLNQKNIIDDYAKEKQGEES